MPATRPSIAVRILKVLARAFAEAGCFFPFVPLYWPSELERDTRQR